MNYVFPSYFNTHSGIQTTPMTQRFFVNEQIAKKTLDLGLMREMPWRPKDIVISGAPRSGTHWMQNIVHQLRSGGDPEFEDIKREVPHLDKKDWDVPKTEKLEWFRSMTSPRAFKTHFAPPTVPFHPFVRYVVVIRSIRDACHSHWIFLNNVTDEVRKATAFPYFERFIDFLNESDSVEFYYEFVNEWWARKDADNVFLVHYNDLKEDFPTHAKHIANFLEFDTSNAESFETICECCSFEWMKTHQQKFEMLGNGKRFIEKGNMIRRGKIGSGKRHMSDNERAYFEALERDWFSPDLLGWVERMESQSIHAQ